MVNLDLFCITLGTTNTWHFHSPIVWYNRHAMKETLFVVNISYNHEYLTTFTGISII
jgi:hypothetical protein